MSRIKKAYENPTTKRRDMPIAMTEGRERVRKEEADEQNVVAISILAYLSCTLYASRACADIGERASWTLSTRSRGDREK